VLRTIRATVKTLASLTVLIAKSHRLKNPTAHGVAIEDIAAAPLSKG